MIINIHKYVAPLLQYNPVNSSYQKLQYYLRKNKFINHKNSIKTVSSHLIVTKEVFKFWE